MNQPISLAVLWFVYKSNTIVLGKQYDKACKEIELLKEDLKRLASEKNGLTELNSILKKKYVEINVKRGEMEEKIEDIK